MKKNARIVAGFVLMGLGWAGLIYGVIVDLEANRLRQECEPNCWEFGAEFSISVYTLAGIILITIGAVVFISGRRAMKYA